MPGRNSRYARRRVAYPNPDGGLRVGPGHLEDARIGGDAFTRGRAENVIIGKASPPDPDKS